MLNEVVLETVLATVLAAAVLLFSFDKVVAFSADLMGAVLVSTSLKYILLVFKALSPLRNEAFRNDDPCWRIGLFIFVAVLQCRYCRVPNGSFFLCRFLAVVREDRFDPLSALAR